MPNATTENVVGCEQLSSTATLGFGNEQMNFAVDDHAAICAQCGKHGPSGADILEASELALSERWDFYSSLQPWQYRLALSHQSPPESCEWLCPECCATERKAQPPSLQLGTFEVELIARHGIDQTISGDEFRIRALEILAGCAQRQSWKFPELAQALEHLQSVNDFAGGCGLQIGRDATLHLNVGSVAACVNNDNNQSQNV